MDVHSYIHVLMIAVGYGCSFVGEEEKLLK